MKFPAQSVRITVITGFGVMLVALVTLAVVSITQVQSIRERLDDIIDLNGVKERYAINFRGSVHDRSIALRDVTLVEKDELPAVVQNIRKLQHDYDQSADPLEKIFLGGSNVNEDEKSIYAGIKAAQARTLPLIDQVIDLQSGGKPDEARKILLDSARPAFVSWLAAINTMIDYEESLSDTEGTEARQISVTFRVLMGALAAVASILSLVVTWYVTRRISRTLGADPAK